LASIIVEKGAIEQNLPGTEAGRRKGFASKRALSYDKNALASQVISHRKMQIAMFFCYD
jgi:hypothetical protein